ncbi:MAG: PAS domain S-box protein [Desulfovibrionaceae bacterium]|nr:PAS domain S-box protein [Desulfovibrionaceae bacterium]
MQESNHRVSAVSEKSFPGFVIFKNFPVASIFFDLSDGGIVFWNQAASKLTGYDPESFSLITDFADAMIPNGETCELFKKLLFLPLQTDEVQRTPVTCLTSEGRPFVAEMQVWQTTGNDYPANARVLHLLELASNDPVVERLRKYSLELNSRIKESTSELDRHKQWLAMALEGSREGVWTIDFKADTMEFLYTNLLSLLGYDSEDIENTQISWDNLTHPDDLPEVHRRLQQHFDGLTPFYEAEYRAKAKNGEWRWILGHGKVVRRDSEGRPLEAIGTHMDIDRLKRTEENLRKSESQFRTLVENAPVALILVSPDGKFLYANPRFTDLSGHDHTEFDSIENWWAVAYPNAEAHAEFLRKLEEGNPFHTEIVGRGDLEKQVIVHFAKLPDGSSFIAYEDITSQSIYERTLLKREKELHEKSEKLEEMNAALRVILNRMNSDKDELESKVYMNIRDLVMPYVDKLESMTHNEVQQSYLNIIKQNLQNIASSFAVQFSKRNVSLTPREIQIANMINENMSNKDIAAILYISESSVEFHRHNIRKKLGLVDKKVNLKTYLRGML